MRLPDRAHSELRGGVEAHGRPDQHVVQMSVTIEIEGKNMCVAVALKQVTRRRVTQEHIGVTVLERAANERSMEPLGLR